MSRNIYGKKRGIPLSNKILMIASLVCATAAIVVFIFFNRHQKKKNNDTVLNPPSSSATAPAEATPTPGGRSDRPNRDDDRTALLSAGRI